MRERLFKADIHRRVSVPSDSGRCLRRSYATLKNAIRGAVNFTLEHGYVGDTCEVYHSLTGIQLGTITVRANGRIDINWSWDHEK